MLGNKRLTALLLFIVSNFASGIGSYYLGGKHASKNLQVLYISQKEILGMEKTRVAQESLKDQQLFYGKPQEAIRYIEQLQKEMSNKEVIILLTDNKIYGSNVRSISKEAHSYILKNLSIVAK